MKHKKARNLENLHFELLKARREYISFIKVRELKDIYSSYNLTKTLLRLEDNLIRAKVEYKRRL